ncbi:MAG: DsrE family protein [Gammaproteobacteria bacterium]|nr:DsrE family protein [Gammaproteobacteria bacterium]
MKSLLIMISHSPLAGQHLLESLSAAMVLATYGIQIKICLTGDAVALLRPVNQSQTNTLVRPFKSAFSLVESFEFYDLLPIWIDQKDSVANNTLLATTAIEHEVINLNSDVLASFDGVLRW